MQAARGAPLSRSPQDPHAGAETQQSPRSPKPRRLRGRFVAVLAVGLLLDQATKWWALHHLHSGETRDLVGSLLRLTLVRNPGAAFGAGSGATVAISVFAVIAAGVALWVGLHARTTAWAVTIGILTAGIVGNLVDRVTRDPGPLRGHVVDFLMLPHWPVFNLADCFIDVAAALVVWQLLTGSRLDGTRERGGS